MNWQEIRWRRYEHRPFASRPTMPIGDTTLSLPFPVNPAYLINRYHKCEMGFHERFCYLNYSYISHGCWETCAEIQFWLQIRLLLRINLSLLHVFLGAFQCWSLRIRMFWGKMESRDVENKAMLV